MEHKNTKKTDTIDILLYEIEIIGIDIIGLKETHRISDLSKIWEKNGNIIIHFPTRWNI